MKAVVHYPSQKVAHDVSSAPLGGAVARPCHKLLPQNSWRERLLLLFRCSA